MALECSEDSDSVGTFTGLSGPSECLSLVDALEQACAADSLLPSRPDEPSPGSFSVLPIGRIQIVEAAGLPLSLSTSRVARPAQVTALLQFQGGARIHQGDRTVRLGAGDLCLLRGARSLQLNQDKPFTSILVNVPEKEVADRFPLWRAALLTPIKADSGVPAVFRDAVKSIKHWCRSFGDADCEGVADAVVDLMGALICFAVPANSDCIQRSFHHQGRVKAFALRNLRNPELSVEVIAESVGLSPRQVHRLFAHEEMSLMRWVWVQRLEQCYRELLQDGSGQRTISEIAYAWGFNDQAHFSRTFRKHFGVSPRHLRAGTDLALPTESRAE
jgi:AraC family transcriptional regulator, positive regulator of tynA and feaB